MTIVLSLQFWALCNHSPWKLIHCPLTSCSANGRPQKMGGEDEASQVRALVLQAPSGQTVGLAGLSSGVLSPHSYPLDS